MSVEDIKWFVLFVNASIVPCALWLARYLMKVELRLAKLEWQVRRHGIAEQTQPVPHP